TVDIDSLVLTADGQVLTPASVTFTGGTLTITLDGGGQPDSGTFDIVGSIEVTPPADSASDISLTIGAKGEVADAVPASEPVPVLEVADGGHAMTGTLATGSDGAASLSVLAVDLFASETRA